jgi:hypothetical protein
MAHPRVFTRCVMLRFSPPGGAPIGRGNPGQERTGTACSAAIGTFLFDASQVVAGAAGGRDE